MNIGSSLGISAVQQPQRPDKSPEDLFKSLDAQNKGYITQSEFESSTSTISAEGARLAAQDKESAADAFARLDSDQDGKLTSAEFKAGAPSGPPPGQGPAGGTAGADGGSRPPPPPGGAGAAPTSSETSSYDAADTNQDGTVSAAEKIAAQVKSLSQAADGDGFAAQLAVRQYESTAALTGI